MGQFQNLMVHDLELKEIELKGRKYTWPNSVTWTMIGLPTLLIESVAAGFNYTSFAFAGLWWLSHAPFQMGWSVELQRLWIQGFQEVVQSNWEQPIAYSIPIWGSTQKCKWHQESLKAGQNWRLGITNSSWGQQDKLYGFSMWWLKKT